MTRTEVLVRSPLRLTLTWEGETITAIDLAWSASSDADTATSPLGHRLAELLEGYVAGEAITWPDLPLDWDRLTPFRRDVLQRLARTHPGETLTYGQLAATVGRPGAARAVGRCMATNPWPLVVPCHRVVGSAGLTGFGPGLKMKRWLLDLEATAQNAATE